MHFVAYLSIAGVNPNLISVLANNENLQTLLASRTTNNLIEETTDNNRTIDSVIKLLKRQSDVGVKLKTISDLTPQSLRLTSVSLVNSKTGEWRIEGIGDRDSILAFHKNLEENARVKDIAILYSSFEKETENGIRKGEK